MKTGDRVVCVRSHHQSSVNGVIKGRIFVILGTKVYSCCNSFTIRISNTEYDPDVWVDICCGREHNEDNYWWMNPNRFAPIVENREFISSDEFQEIEETIDLPVIIEQ